MPHNHLFSDALFARLQSHAVPLVDTIDSIIERALDALEAGQEGTIDTRNPTVRTFNPAAPPNLAHTTPKAISLCGRTFKRGEIYWNTLMYEVMRAAAKKSLTAEQIQQLMVVPSVTGKKTDHGYKFLEDVGLSVQGQDANGAWKQAYHIADHLGLPVEVTFVWQDKEAAAMPNTVGSFTVGERQ